MKNTYQKAIDQVFKSEGGYTNEVSDSGGPTNWGITIHDAQMYWKSDATAEDVRDMPKSVAEEIYLEHYAKPIHYDGLPAGVDYTVLDYAINSGIKHANLVLQHFVNVIEDGEIGPITLEAVNKADPIILIEDIWDERLAFLKTLHNWPVYQHGWTERCVEGKALALSMVSEPVAPTQLTKTSIWNFIINLFTRKK